MRPLAALSCLILLAGCDGCFEDARGREGSRPIRRDAATAQDSAIAGDAENGLDATDPIDGADPIDASAPDAAGEDAFAVDSSAPDASPPDTGPPDSGMLDSGQPDSGPPPGTGDVWVEIDYSSAFTPQSPSWSFSATPGWGAGQWAMAGDTWPEAWDRWNNMSVVSDPIGTVLEIGSGSELQLMMGLEELITYQRAIVRVEGRSRATSSAVTFDIFNPLNGCGISGATMSQDWTIHIVEVDLGGCMEIGAGVQAVRVDPTSGTIALTRMRVTLEGAQW